MKALTKRPDWQLLSALVVLVIACKAWLSGAAGFEMHFDEAQYWEWSQQLDWGYYSKGPLIAWLIALSEALFGHGEWQTRLFGWLAHGALLVVMFCFARDVWGSRRAAWWAVLITLLTPMYFTLSLVMTTDNLLLLCWAWALWAMYRALELNRPRAWIEAGAAIGLGALTKLSIGLLPLIVGLLVLARPRWRSHLKDSQLWRGLLLMLLCMSPMLYWNATHDWVMLRHETGHVAADDFSPLRGVEFLLGQFFSLSPLVAALMIWRLWRRPQTEGQRLLWAVGVGCLGFFLFKAMSGKVQLNWPAPSYLGLIVLFAGAIAGLGRGQRRVLYFGLGMSLALMAVAYFPGAFGLPGDKDPFVKNKYWRAPLTELANGAPPADFLLTDTYHLAAELSYYWPQRLPVYITGSAGRRYNQHDLWPAIDRETGRNAVYITDSPAPHPLLAAAFAHCEPLPALAVAAPDGAVVRRLYPQFCRGYQAITWPSPQRY